VSKSRKGRERERPRTPTASRGLALALEGLVDQATDGLGPRGQIGLLAPPFIYCSIKLRRHPHLKGATGAAKWPTNFFWCLRHFGIDSRDHAGVISQSLERSKRDTDMTIFFTEWKHDREMIEDGVLALVADLPTQPGASTSHNYMMLFEVPPLPIHAVESSTHLI